tara:strand:+ start:212 stop:2239 length:2028 start_codon:yes stop_codon:yes gene_type:complete
MKKTNLFNEASLILSVFIVISCGGGGGGGESMSQPTNNPPSITNSTFNYAAKENQLVAFTVTASDPDGDSLTFTISGGTDQEIFSVNSTGTVEFNQTPDFENPSDGDSNNIYEITISVTDGSLKDTKQFYIEVTDDESDNLELGKIYNFDSNAKDHEIINYSGTDYLLSFSANGYNDESLETVTPDDKNYLVNIFELPINQIVANLPEPYKQQFYGIGDFCNNGCANDFKGEVSSRSKLLKNFFNNEDAIVFAAAKRSDNTRKVLIVGISHIIDDDIIFNEDNWNDNFSSYEKIYVIEDTRNTIYLYDHIEVGDFNFDGKDDLFLHRPNHIILSSRIEKYTDLNRLDSSFDLDFEGPIIENRNYFSLPRFNVLRYSNKESLFFVPKLMMCSYYSEFIQPDSGNTNFVDGITMFGQAIKFPQSLEYQKIDTTVSAPSYDVTDQQDCTPIIIEDDSEIEILESSWIFIKGVGYDDTGYFGSSYGQYSHKDMFTSDFHGTGNSTPVFILDRSGPLTYDSSYSQPPYEPGEPKIIVSHEQLNKGINIFDINNPSEFSMISFPSCSRIRMAKNLGDLNRDGYDELYVYLGNQGSLGETTSFDLNLIIKGTNNQDHIDLSDALNCSSMDYSDSNGFTILNPQSISNSSAHKFSEVVNVVYDINGDSKLDILFQGKLVTPFE